MTVLKNLFMLIFVFLLQSNAFYINMQLCNLTKYISIFHLMSFSDIDIGQSEAYLPFSLNHLSRFLFRWVSSIYRLAKKQNSIVLSHWKQWKNSHVRPNYDPGQITNWWLRCLRHWLVLTLAPAPASLSL